jgi:hypothetical protein
VRRIRPQIVRRMYDQQCLLCGEADPAVLDAHRLIPGSKYDFHSLVTLCAVHHRLWHAGRVVFLGRHMGSRGWMLHLMVDGKEVFVPQSRRGL